MVSYIYKLCTLIFYLSFAGAKINHAAVCNAQTYTHTDTESVAAIHHDRDEKSSLSVAFDLLFLHILLVHRAG